MAQVIPAAEFLALKRASAQNPIVIDLRTKAEIDSEHLPDSVHLPLHELSEERLSQCLSSNQCSAIGPVYLLCQSGKRAEVAASKLGQFEAVILEGGLNALKAAGAEVKTGEKQHISIERQVRITAGVLILLGVVLGFSAHAGFFLLSGFVGAGLTFAGITDNCAMAFVLARMPWNNRA